MTSSKKRIAFFAILAFMVLMVCTQVHAVPDLQIYIPGATYDTSTETWVINAYEYDLWVIGANVEISDVKFAAAVPTDEDGTISVDSLTFSEEGGMDYTDYRSSYKNSDPDPSTYGFGIAASGDYPLMGDGSPLPGHGVFPTDFYEYFIGDFGLGETVHNYIPGDEWTDTADGEIKQFHITVAGYSWVDFVAYDHYIKTNGDAKSIFSPFSHDGGGTAPVPEPATMLLFGVGLCGLAFVGRKKFKKADS